MTVRDRKDRRPESRGQPGSVHDTPEAKRRRVGLPVQARLCLDESLPANEHYPLAQLPSDVHTSTCWQLIDGMPEGDCFVVVNFRGQCWDGTRWVALWSDGVQFRRPDPAYELCEQAAQEAEHATGIAATVCYIPPGTPASHVLCPFPDFSQVDLRDLALKPEVC